MLFRALREKRLGRAQRLRERPVRRVHETRDGSVIRFVRVSKPARRARPPVRLAEIHRRARVGAHVVRVVFVHVHGTARELLVHRARAHGVVAPADGYVPLLQVGDAHLRLEGLLEEPARVAQRVGKHALFDAVVGREEESNALARVRHLFHDARVRLGVAPLERAEVDRRHGDRHRNDDARARGGGTDASRRATPRARWSDARVKLRQQNEAKKMVRHCQKKSCADRKWTRVASRRTRPTLPDSASRETYGMHPTHVSSIVCPSCRSPACR